MNDLTTTPTREIEAELVRRRLASLSVEALQAELDYLASRAPTSAKRVRYATKAEWARAQLQEFQRQKDKLKEESGTGGTSERLRRRDSYRALDEQIEKFTRLVRRYEENGE